MNKRRITQLHRLTEGAAIAALYILLTLLSASVGLSSGAIQFRISEALAILPVFTPAALPGLFIGCLAANLLTGGAPWDILIGSLVTLISAFLARLLRRHPYLAPLPNACLNSIAIPLLLAYVYASEAALPVLFASVAIGEAVTGIFFAYLLYRAIAPRASRIFASQHKKGFHHDDHQERNL